MLHFNRSLGTMATSLYGVIAWTESQLIYSEELCSNNVSDKLVFTSIIVTQG
jgi:hypothetical protein